MDLKKLFSGWGRFHSESPAIDNSQSEALKVFAREHHLDDKVLSIGVVRDVAKARPSSGLETSGNVCEVMFHDKGDGMNIYVGEQGRLGVARDIYSGRVYDNALPENGLTAYNISQLKTDDQKRVIDRVSSQLAHHYMVADGADRQQSAIRVVSEHLSDPDAKSLTTGQRAAVREYLSDYVPIGMQHLAAGSLFSAAGGNGMKNGDSRRLHAFRKELDGILNDVKHPGVTAFPPMKVIVARMGDNGKIVGHDVTVSAARVMDGRILLFDSVKDAERALVEKGRYRIKNGYFFDSLSLGDRKAVSSAFDNLSVGSELRTLASQSIDASETAMKKIVRHFDQAVKEQEEQAATKGIRI